MKKITKEDLLAAFETESSGNDRSLCPIGNLLANTEPDLREVLQAKLDDQVHVSSTAYSKVLKRLGLPPISDKTVIKHRRGECRCPR